MTATVCGSEPKGSGCCDKLEIKSVAAVAPRTIRMGKKDAKSKRPFQHLTMIPHFVIWLRREIGEKQRVKVSNRKGIANQTGPESCVAHGEVRDEALTGEPAGQSWSRESYRLVRASQLAVVPVSEQPECISRLAVAPAHWVSASRKSAPECPVPGRRQHYHETRFELSLGADARSPSNLRCLAFQLPPPQLSPWRNPRSGLPNHAQARLKPSQWRWP